MEKKVLDLVLMHKWYDMIDKGEKPEEYRANTEYWRRRLTNLEMPISIFQMKCDKPIPYKDYTHVCFHRGYTSTTMLWEIGGIRFGYGNKSWGAPDEPCHIIALSERVE